jgi:hypothetical protein
VDESALTGESLPGLTPRGLLPPWS